MSKNTTSNALKGPTEGALTASASYRNAIRSPNILDIGNRDPGRVYRWLSKSMLDKYGGFDRRGWEILNEKNSKGESLTSQWGIHSTGSDLRVGDVVAGFMPVERNEIKKAALAEANKALSRRIDDFKRSAVGAGAKVNGGFSSQRDGITENYGNPIAD